MKIDFNIVLFKHKMISDGYSVMETQAILDTIRKCSEEVKE